MKSDLMFEFLNITESAAIAALPWVGRGDKNAADDAATTAMRIQLNSLDIDAVVVIGEGELDNAPMLYIGEQLGTKKGPSVDIAVDPLDGTTFISNGQGDSISVLAVAPRGSLLHAPDMYMEKIAVGNKAFGKINLNLPIKENIRIVADACNKKINEVTVTIQNRERHNSLIEEILEVGARIQLFNDVDVTSAIAPAIEETGIDMFIGTGGAPEGVISAVALKCLGGELQGRLIPSNKGEYNRCIEMGLDDPSAVLRMEELVSSENCYFAATGITDGKFLKGVKQLKGNKFQTHSLITSGTSRRAFFIESTLDLVGQER